jgi:hypothetical protein
MSLENWILSWEIAGAIAETIASPCSISHEQRDTPFGRNSERSLKHAGLTATRTRWESLSCWTRTLTQRYFFVESDESNSIEDAVKYAKRTNMLECLELSEAEFRGLLFDFAAEKKGWTADMKAKNAVLNPRSWWVVKRAEKDLYNKLSYIADLVFSISTSSAASERAWSIRDHIHSKKRNCLKSANVDMFTYVYINGGIMHGKNIDTARLQSYPESEAVDTESSAA